MTTVKLANNSWRTWQSTLWLAAALMPEKPKLQPVKACLQTSSEVDMDLGQHLHYTSLL